MGDFIDSQRNIENLINELNIDQWEEGEINLEESYENVNLEMDAELMNEFNRLAVGESEIKDVGEQGAAHVSLNELDISNVKHIDVEEKLDHIDENLLEELYKLTGHPVKQERNKDDIIREQKQYKLKALEFKKQGDLNSAKQYMLKAKQLDKLLDVKLLDIEKLDKMISSNKPKMNIKSDLNNSPIIKTPVMEVKKIIQPSTIDQLDELQAKIELQCEEAGQLARQYYKVEDKVNAIRFQRYKKVFLKYLESVKSCKKVPPYKIQEISYVLPKFNLDIPPNQIEFKINKANHLFCNQLNGKLVDSYFTYEFNYNNNPITGSSKVIYQNADPKYEFQTNFMIEKTKAFERFLERKSIILNFFHYRGFFFKPYNIGSINIPLIELLVKNSVLFELNLTQANRRSLESTVAGSLRLRTPFRVNAQGREVKKWIVLLEDTMGHDQKEEKGDLDISNRVADVNKVQIIKKQETIVKETEVDLSAKEDNKEDTKEDKGDLKHIKQQGIVTKSIKYEEKENQKEEQETKKYNNEEILKSYNGIERLVSKPVLEQELQNTEDETKKQELQIKLQMMEVQVMSGQLSIHQYLQGVKNELTNTQQLIVQLKKIGLLKEAKHLLVQFKIMKKEVEDINNMLN